MVINLIIVCTGCGRKYVASNREMVRGLKCECGESLEGRSVNRPERTTILVVEEEEQVRTLVEAILEESGFDTVSASDVDEARALLKTDQQIDVLFTELALKNSEHGGFELAKEARVTRSSLRVVYTSGGGMTDGMQAMMVEGGRFYRNPTRRLI